jgi:hypothetical protein
MGNSDTEVFDLRGEHHQAEVVGGQLEDRPQVPPRHGRGEHRQPQRAGRVAPAVGADQREHAEQAGDAQDERQQHQRLPERD